MKVVVVLALLAGVAYVKASSIEQDLVLKYGKIKMMENCMGKEESKRTKNKVRDAYKICKAKPVEYKGVANANAGSDPVVAKVPEGDYQYFTEDKVRSLSRKLVAKISNKTCVFRELGFIDASDELLYENITNEIKNIKGLDLQVQEDLLESVQLCKQVATCIKTDNILVPSPPQHIRFKVFLKCYKQKKLMACLKKDLRAKSSEFDFSAPEDANDMVDEDDKMLALIWGQAAMGDLMGYD
ncbi:uncharacterized protein LOC108679577 [Hyalella azteca]|uniref:Uncharacterized protein LOC108679577 n=1 Tax=Hyalella azteca TaxID=294128 RepID=A0A8B7PCA2_HYAAZ|nr:uncharacterized protein LOC108679577 [Hyalella azteca]